MYPLGAVAFRLNLCRGRFDFQATAAAPVDLAHIGCSDVFASLAWDFGFRTKGRLSTVWAIEVMYLPLLCQHDG